MKSIEAKVVVLGSQGMFNVLSRPLRLFLYFPEQCDAVSVS